MTGGHFDDDDDDYYYNHYIYASVVDSRAIVIDYKLAMPLNYSFYFISIIMFVSCHNIQLISVFP